MDHNLKSKGEDTMLSVWVETTPSNFVYTYINDRSHMGVFIETETPFQVDTPVNLIFQDQNLDKLITACGEVSFVNLKSRTHKTPNPGMGVRFKNLSQEKYKVICNIVKRIAYI